MKRLIIAEKPSVAADLSKALGGASAGIKKKGEYYEGDDLVISSAVGHLVELYMPDDIDPKLKYWKMGTLPIVPETFQLKVIPKTKRKFNELKTLMKRKDIGEIYNACDAGREGELIFTYIYELAGCSKPVHRMWMLSMTPAAILKSFEKPRSGDDMLRLQNAARCRSEADWLIGINGTRAITLQMGGLRKMTTVGRVQTPTLTLVVNREKEINAFVPRSYSRLVGSFKIVSGTYEGVYQRPDFKRSDDKHDRVDRIWNPEETARILAALENGTTASVEEKKKRTPQISPRLYDLTTLQREANNKFGMSASRTLQVAQALYEKHKVITYPRTDSKALPEDYGDSCVNVLKSFSGEDKPYAEKVLENNWVSTDNRRIFNNKQISDHFAIVPTNQEPKNLSSEDAKIYRMISRRFIAVFYPPAQFDVTTRLSQVGDHTFKTEGKVLVEPSWLAIYGKDNGQQENLPALTPEDGNPPTGSFASVERQDEETKPPPHYTEATLLSGMEGAGKLVEDEEMAEAMKEKGLGTPATRAATIEHLIKEEYIRRDGRDIYPREKAEDLIEFLDAVKVEGLTSPDMTGEWEHKLLQMEKGELSREDFMNGIIGFTKNIVERAGKYENSDDFLKPTEVVSPTDGQALQESLTHYISKDKKLKINKTMGNRRILIDEIAEILDKGSIGPLEGFLSKAKKPFIAYLKYDPDDLRVKFDFDRDAPKSGENGEDAGESKEDPRDGENIGSCPECKQPVFETSMSYACPDCKCSSTSPFHRFSKNVLGKAITRDQFQLLLDGKTTELLEGFRSKKTGRNFSARLAVRKSKLSFEFENNNKGKKKAAPKGTD